MTPVFYQTCSIERFRTNNVRQCRSRQTEKLPLTFSQIRQGVFQKTSRQTFSEVKRTWNPLSGIFKKLLQNWARNLQLFEKALHRFENARDKRKKKPKALIYHSSPKERCIA